MSLAQLYEDRGEVDALGILMQIIDPQFILAAMMLADMLGNVQYTKINLQSIHRIIYFYFFQA